MQSPYMPQFNEMPSRSLYEEETVLMGVSLLREHKLFTRAMVQVKIKSLQSAIAVLNKKSKQRKQLVNLLQDVTKANEALEYALTHMEMYPNLVKAIHDAQKQSLPSSDPVLLDPDNSGSIHN